jgi:hypothetical protein
LAEPPAKTVVLRPGPPKRQWKEVVIGVLGILLIASTVVLAVRLPEETILPPQYQVTFPVADVDLPSQTNYFDLSEQGRRHDFLFNITHDNVVGIRINVHFQDDISASDPDRFNLELFDPNGNPLGNNVIMNPVPQQNGTTYVAVQVAQTYTYGLRQKPDEVVVEADLNSTPELVRLEQARLNHFSTKGTWRLAVTLISAGGCPLPSVANPNPDDVLRGSVCRQQTTGPGMESGRDPGNALTVGYFSYTHFTTLAERLD